MFDKQIKRESIFGGVPENVHARLDETLRSIREEETMKKARLQPILIITILLILCGAAVAAVTQWDVLSVITRENYQGETVVNEELIPLVQKMDQTVSGKYLKITMADALFDGRTIAAAWEIENISEDTLIYVMARESQNSVNWDNEGSASGVEEFLKPGQTMTASMNRSVYGNIGDDTILVGIRYYVFAPTAEVAAVDFPIWQEGADFMEKIQAHEAELQRQSGDGKLAISIYNEERMGLSNAFMQEVTAQYDLLDESNTQMDAMVATGKLTLLEAVDMEFELQIAQKPISFLPKNEPIEKEYDDFTMRIFQANYTPSTIEILVEAVFDEEEMANQYREDSILSFVALNDAGDTSWEGNVEWHSNSVGIEKRADGKWSIEYIILFRDLIALPEKLTVCPAWTALNTIPGEGLFSVETLEGVTLIVR